MSRKDAFGDDETKPMDDFGAMLERSLNPRRLAVGDQISGEILSLGKEEAFVSTGTPVDGRLPIQELWNEHKQVAVRVGDHIDVVVLKVSESEVRLRKKGAQGSSADVESLEDAFDMEIPVEGKVTEVVKGGYRVSIMGKTAFCPVSQIDLRPGNDSASYIGLKADFMITRFEEKGRNIVVSRRRALELTQAENEGTFLQSHKVDDVIDGKVTRLETFGAFVEIAPGVEGLVHISEISWSRLAHPSEVLASGTPVRAKILKMEEEGTRMRISLSIKQGGGESDPWLDITRRFPVGTMVDGTVAKKESFGLFVVLGPGVQGLLPRSKWRDSTESSSYETKKKGDTVKVQVTEIQEAEKRLTLGLPEDKVDDSWREHGVSSAKGGLGTFGDLFAQMNAKKK